MSTNSALLALANAARWRSALHLLQGVGTKATAVSFNTAAMACKAARKTTSIESHIDDVLLHSNHVIEVGHIGYIYIHSYARRSRYKEHIYVAYHIYIYICI